MNNSTTPTNNPVQERLWRKHIFAILFSNAASVFDFIIFVHLAGVIGATFFSDNAGSFVNHLQALGLFSVGYLSRPFGAILIGRYGDIHGRSSAFKIGLSLFTVATFLTAILPTYAQVGLLAPLLFIIARLIQGMAFGAQMPMVWVLMVEYAPRHKLALYCSFASISLTVGNLLAFIVAKVLSSTLSQAALMSYGWRIPFVMGGIISLSALFLRRGLNETPLFLQYQRDHEHDPKFTNIMPAFQRHQAVLLTAILSFIHISLATTMLLTPHFLAIKFNLDDTFLTTAYITILVSLALGFIFYGKLADKFPVGRVMMGGAVMLIITALLFYLHPSKGNLYFIMPMCALLGFTSGVRVLYSVIFVQLFPTQERLTSIPFIFNCVSVVVGTAVPVSLYYVSNIVESAPGLFITFLGILTAMIGLIVNNSPGLNKLEALTDDKYSSKNPSLATL